MSIARSLKFNTLEAIVFATLMLISSLAHAFSDSTQTTYHTETVGDVVGFRLAVANPERITAV
jgi:uncharacterized membrane protein